jgi:hypothetical protein
MLHAAVALNLVIFVMVDIFLFSVLKQGVYLVSFII